MKRLFGGLHKRGEFREPAENSSADAAFWRSTIDSLRERLGASSTTWLLLTWDVSGMEAALMQTGKDGSNFLGKASSRQGRFAAALDEVMAQLASITPIRPKRVALAARHVLPAVVDLPVHPDKPRQPEQMRELIQADLEPVLAEFGSLWSMGALLQARGYLSPADRERITMEEAVRRQSRSNQLRYGEIAIELALIERDLLDECLDQQVALQNLEASVMAGWRGRIEDKQPLWLVCGVGQTTYREWHEALSRRGLYLAATLPISWLVSDPASIEPIEPGTRRDQPVSSIDLEIHAEEVVAVLRRRGRVVATRSEGRIERAPAADWVNRIIADWTAESRAQIVIHFMDAADDEFGELLADALNLTTGHPCSIRKAGEVRLAIWRNLLREANAPLSQLPRMVAGELRGSLWKDHDIRRLLALGIVLIGLAATEGVQQYRLHGLEKKMVDHQRKEKQLSSNSQMEAQVNQKLLELGKGLETTRRQLEPLLNDRSRLNRIISMRVDLPDLLYLLAQAVGSDAVMEEIHNDNTHSEGSAIQVIAWSPNYTGAQDFVNRMAALAREKGYGVSQMEIKERKGRDNRRGHEVKFWLLLEDSELEANEHPSAVQNSVQQPMPAGTGISSQPPAPRATP